MIGESVAQKLKAVPLRNNTVCRRIDKISDDISDQPVAKMHVIDETTTNTSHKDAYLIC